MGGGLMQIAAYGEQDIYLVGNPQITFFKVVYRRHSNFSIESIEQSFTGDADFGKKVEAVIARGNGDLLSSIYLEVVLPALNQSQNSSTWHGWVNSIGHCLMESATLQIAGQEIEKHYPEWMEIWSELTLRDDQRQLYNTMIGKYETDASLETNATSAKRLYIPLQFWFCRNPGLAIPLVALNYHEVKVVIQFRQLSELTRSDVEITTAQDSAGDTATITSASLYCDYITLDDDERRRFSQNHHEYLIEQVQFLGNKEVDASIASQRVKLSFEHPVKELMWALSRDSNRAINTSTGNKLVDFSSSLSTDTFSTLKLQFNGQDRFSVRNSDYFRLVQPYQAHSGNPRKHCYCYSFGLKPEEHQPTGQANMSRLDSINMMFTFNSADVVASLWKIYAINYNILRFHSGMAGLAF